MSATIYSIGGILFLTILTGLPAHAQQGIPSRRIADTPYSAGISEGQPVPKVSALKTDGTRVELSSPARFTVLVFGSHT